MAMEPPKVLLEPAMSAAAEPPARKRQKLTKVRGNLAHMCTDFVKTGACGFGDTCRFAHCQSELKPSMRRPELPAARKQLAQRCDLTEQTVGAVQCCALTVFFSWEQGG